MVTGAAFPGGYAEYVVAPATALARIPDELSAVDAAPIACAGLTMFNSLRRTGAGPAIWSPSSGSAASVISGSSSR